MPSLIASRENQPKTENSNHYDEKHMFQVSGV